MPQNLNYLSRKNCADFKQEKSSKFVGNFSPSTTTKLSSLDSDSFFSLCLKGAIFGVMGINRLKMAALALANKRKHEEGSSQDDEEELDEPVEETQSSQSTNETTSSSTATVSLSPSTKPTPLNVEKQTTVHSTSPNVSSSSNGSHNSQRVTYPLERLVAGAQWPPGIDITQREVSLNTTSPFQIKKHSKMIFVHLKCFDCFFL
jgi:hypothetical protein